MPHRIFSVFMHSGVLISFLVSVFFSDECQIVMYMLWPKLQLTGKDWQCVYKALILIEYLVAHGSDRAVEGIIEHMYQIAASSSVSGDLMVSIVRCLRSLNVAFFVYEIYLPKSLSNFEYVEPGGKDVGIYVRTRAEKIVALLNDQEKIQQVGNKAEVNQNKSVGLSSTGVSYKPASSSSGISSFQSGNKYRETSNETARRGDEKSSYPRTSSQARANVEGNSTKKLPARVSWPSDLKSPSKTVGTNKGSTPSKMYDKDNEDDFNPRGTSSPKTVAGNSTRVEQPGLDLIDLLDAPAPAVADNATNVQDMQSHSSQTDLFADADFVSASSAGSIMQDQVDLFASGSTISPVGPPAVNLFATPNAATELPEEPTKPDPPNLTDFFPFPAVPPPNADSGPDPFMEFKLVSNPAEVSSPKTDVNGKPSSEPHAPPRKETFRIKSGVWADSLSRGLINLDIAEPKKVSLADVGMVGDPSVGGDLWEKKAHQ